MPKNTQSKSLADPVVKRPRGRPRKSEDERDDGNRRHELLTQAARLFRLKGFDATSTRDIAAAVGMHSGSPFYHFKSKDALLYAVMEEGALGYCATSQCPAGCRADGGPAPGADQAADTRSL